MINITKIEVTDEILNGEPRYEIKDDSGKVIATNCTIELITELLSKGSDINKSLFDKINFGFEAIQKQKLGESITLFDNYKILKF